MAATLVLQAVALIVFAATPAGGSQQHAASYLTASRNARPVKRTRANLADLSSIASTSVFGGTRSLESKQECTSFSRWQPSLAACVCDNGYHTSQDGRSCVKGSVVQSDEFALADVDGDGFLAEREWPARLPKDTFSQSDLDGDGKVHPTEFLGPKGIDNVLPKLPRWIDAIKVATAIAARYPHTADALLSAAADAPEVVVQFPEVQQQLRLFRALHTSKDGSSLLKQVALFERNETASIATERGAALNLQQEVQKHLFDRKFLPAYVRGRASCINADIELAKFASLSVAQRFAPARLGPILTDLKTCYENYPPERVRALQTSFELVDESYVGVPTCSRDLIKLHYAMEKYNATSMPLQLRVAQIFMICGNSSAAVDVLCSILTPFGYTQPVMDNDFLIAPANGRDGAGHSRAPVNLPKVAEFLANRFAVLGRLEEAQALCQRLAVAGYELEGPGMSCAMTLAVIDTKRRKFRNAVERYPKALLGIGPGAKPGPDQRGPLAGTHDRHIAEITATWVEASRFNATELPQPTATDFEKAARQQDPAPPSANSGSGEWNNGGWGTRESIEMAGEGRCNIDIRHPGIDITPEQFQREYVYLNRPVVLRGLCKDWPATKTWSRASLLNRYGDLPFKVKRGSDIAHDKILASDPSEAAGTFNHRCLSSVRCRRHEYSFCHVTGLAIRNRKIALKEFVEEVLDTHRNAPSVSCVAQCQRGRCSMLHLRVMECSLPSHPFSCSTMTLFRTTIQSTFWINLLLACCLPETSRVFSSRGSQRI